MLFWISMWNVHLAPNERTFAILYRKIRLLQAEHNGTCIWKVVCSNKDYTHENDKGESIMFDLIRIDQDSYNATGLVDILWGSNTDRTAFGGTYGFECVWECVGCKCCAMASEDYEMLQQLHQLYHFPILDGIHLHGDCIVFCVE